MERMGRQRSGVGGWALWVVAAALGAILGVALNVSAYQALYSVAILLSGREDPSRAAAVVGSFALYIACVALAQGAALTIIQRSVLRRAHSDMAADAAHDRIHDNTVDVANDAANASGAPRHALARPDATPGKPRSGDSSGAGLGWRWALATLAALLTYYPLLLFGGQPPFDRLGLPTAAQPGLLNAATLYGALVVLTLPIGVVVGAAQGLAVYGWRGWTQGFQRGWAAGGQWRWLAVNTLAWGFAWPLGLLLGNAISFSASFVVNWVALACVTGAMVVGHIGGAVAASGRASE